MAKKTRQKATEQKSSASITDQQHKPVRIIFSKQTNQLSISELPPLNPHASWQANQLSRELSSTLRQADAEMEVSVHAVLITLFRIQRNATGEYEMDEERPQYVN
jgi:hypothetical protein